jgi:hypothetical protein
MERRSKIESEVPSEGKRDREIELGTTTSKSKHIKQSQESAKGQTEVLKKDNQISDNIPKEITQSSDTTRSKKKVHDPAVLESTSGKLIGDTNKRQEALNTTTQKAKELSHLGIILINSNLFI